MKKIIWQDSFTNFLRLLILFYCAVIIFILFPPNIGSLIFDVLIIITAFYSFFYYNPVKISDTSIIILPKKYYWSLNIKQEKVKWENIRNFSIKTNSDAFNMN